LIRLVLVAREKEAVVVVFVWKKKLLLLTKNERTNQAANGEHVGRQEKYGTAEWCTGLY